MPADFTRKVNQHLSHARALAHLAAREEGIGAQACLFSAQVCLEYAVTCFFAELEAVVNPTRALEVAPRALADVFQTLAEGSIAAQHDTAINPWLHEWVAEFNQPSSWLALLNRALLHYRQAPAQPVTLNGPIFSTDITSDTAQPGIIAAKNLHEEPSALADVLVWVGKCEEMIHRQRAHLQTC